MVGINTGTQDPNTVLTNANAVPSSTFDPNQIMKVEAAALIPVSVLVELGFGIAWGGVFLVAVMASNAAWQRTTPQYWGWEGNASNLQLNTWGQIGGGGGPIHIPN